MGVELAAKGEVVVIPASVEEDAPRRERRRGWSRASELSLLLVSPALMRSFDWVVISERMGKGDTLVFIDTSLTREPNLLGDTFSNFSTSRTSDNQHNAQ